SQQTTVLYAFLMINWTRFKGRKFRRQWSHPSATDNSHLRCLGLSPVASSPFGTLRGFSHSVCLLSFDRWALFAHRCWLTSSLFNVRVQAFPLDEKRNDNQEQQSVR